MLKKIVVKGVEKWGWNWVFVRDPECLEMSDINTADAYGPAIQSTAVRADSILNRPYLKMLYERPDIECVIKFEGGFQADEHKFVEEWAQRQGMMVLPLIKAANGGGMNASGSGKIFMTKTDAVDEILNLIGIKEEFHKLPHAKFVNRLGKVFGEMRDLPKYKAFIMPKDKEKWAIPEGILIADPAWMRQNGVVVGEKTTLVCKGLIFPWDVKRRGEWPYEDFNLMVPEDELKIKVSVDKLNELQLIKYMPSQAPRLAYSRNLDNGRGRNPKLGFDVQNNYSLIHREFHKMDALKLSFENGASTVEEHDLYDKALNQIFELSTGVKPIEYDFKEERELYERGFMSQDLLWSLFGYKTRTGEIRLQGTGLLLEAGLNPHSAIVWEEVKRALTKRIITKLTPRVRGIYGVASPWSMAPADAKIHEGWGFRPPCDVLVWVRYKKWGNTIAIDEEFMKSQGGDFDRDHIMIIFKNKNIHGEYSWPESSRFLKAIMKAPEKEVGKTDPKETVNDRVRYQLLQYRGCGQIFNNANAVCEAARLAGWAEGGVRDLNIHLKCQDVQPFINGFKYCGGGEVPNTKDLAKKYYVTTTHIKEAVIAYRAIRGRNTSIDNIIDIGKHSYKHSRSMYVRMCCMFGDWKSPTITKTAVLSPYDIFVIKKSSMAFRNSPIAERYNYCKCHIGTGFNKKVDSIIANCIARRDFNMAIATISHVEANWLRRLDRIRIKHGCYSLSTTTTGL